MKPTMIRMSDACEVAFMGFALDVQDNGAGLWDGVQDGEAVRVVLKWAGWLGEDGQLLHDMPFPYALLVPANTSAEMIERVAAVLREEGDAEGEYAETCRGEERLYARRASGFLCSLSRSLSRLAIRRDKAALKKAMRRRIAKAARVVWTHYTSSTITYLVVGWRECGCGAKVAELVMDATTIYADLRCTRTGGAVGFLLYEGERRGEVLNAKPCDADPDADWVGLLAGVKP